MFGPGPSVTHQKLIKVLKDMGPEIIHNLCLGSLEGQGIHAKQLAADVAKIILSHILKQYGGAMIFMGRSWEPKPDSWRSSRNQSRNQPL